MVTCPSTGHIMINHFTTEHIPHHETSTSFSRTNKSPIEQEANQFAGQLLIPENVTDYATVHRKYTTLQPLADLFGVNQVAMRAGLTELGITN